MIDIILATYNGEKYIKEQIESIQSNFDYEQLISKIIVVDDGSIDSTCRIVENLSKKDKKITLKLNKSGLHGACNNFVFGLSLSDSDYIMFCDQDDTWLKDKIRISFNTIKESESRYQKIPLLVFADKLIVNESLELICDSYFTLKKIDKDWYRVFTQLLQQNVVSGCTMLFNKNLKDQALPVPERAYMHDWWLALFASYFGKIIFIDKPLIQYRQHSANSIGANKRSRLGLVTGFFTHLKAFEKSFIDSVNQASAFSERIHELDNQEGVSEKEALDIFTSIFAQSRYSRLKHLLSRRVTRSNAAGRFALFLILMKQPVSTESAPITNQSTST